MSFRRGQIDQGITTVVVLIIAFFLSVFFVIGTSNLSRLAGSSGEVKEIEFSNARSQVLSDVFLSENIVIDGRIASVREHLLSYFASSGEPKYELPLDERIAFISPLENVFNNSFSCDGKNELYVVHDSPGGRFIHIDYPSKRYAVAENGVGLPRLIREDSEGKDGELYSIISGNTIDLDYSVNRASPNLFIVVREVRRC